MSRLDTASNRGNRVERAGLYLMVEERDKSSGASWSSTSPRVTSSRVRHCSRPPCGRPWRKPAWRVQLQGVLGTALYTAPANGVTYYRTTFLATPVAELENAVLDPDIHLQTHWLDYEEILQRSAKMRSPLVIASIDRHRQGILLSPGF